MDIHYLAGCQNGPLRTRRTAVLVMLLRFREAAWPPSDVFAPRRSLVGSNNIITKYDLRAEYTIARVLHGLEAS